MKNIFIHGWSFSNLIWKEYFDIENSEFLDLPYHGENTDISIKENIINNFVNSVANKIEKNEQINLIGWSLGASVSVLLSLKLKEKVNKLVLIGFSPKFKDKNLGHNPIAIKAFLFALNTMYEETIYNFRKTASGKRFKNIPLPKKEGSIFLLKEFIELDIRDYLREIETETVLIHGKNDKIINPNGSVYSSKLIKNSKLVLVEGNHAPFLKDKRLILNHIGD